MLSYRTVLEEVGFRQEEQISITCLGPSSQVLKEDGISIRPFEYIRSNGIPFHAITTRCIIATTPGYVYG